MDNLLTRKLELFGQLADHEKSVLDKIIGNPCTVAAHTDIIREGESPTDVHLVTKGLCYRYKHLQNGRRQIFAYLVPGDFCDLNVYILKKMDHSIATVSSSQVVYIARDRILEMLDYPRIARALSWATLVDEATLREWMLNLGQRDAEKRIAHLFCELHLRMQCVGLTEDGRFELLLTQTELGDTMGLSSVYVNRSLQSLRAHELIKFNGKSIEIANVPRLQHFAEFNPNYLHLNGGKEDRRR